MRNHILRIYLCWCCFEVGLNVDWWEESGPRPEETLVSPSLGPDTLHKMQTSQRPRMGGGGEQGESRERGGRGRRREREERGRGRREGEEGRREGEGGGRGGGERGEREGGREGRGMSSL